MIRNKARPGKGPPTRPLTAEQLSAQREQALRVVVAMREHNLTEECEEDFKTFAAEAWKIVEPGARLEWGWHHDALAEHLVACYRRDILRLIINISPRSAKSTFVSVLFPAWVWIKRAQEKFVGTSYGRKISLRDARKHRALVKSQWYQSRWGDRYTLTSDQDEKGRFENNQGGYRIAGSVEAGILGEGGTIIVLDDCNNLDKMREEPDYAQKVKDWYGDSMASRFIDPKTDIRINIQQRSPYGDDLTSFLLELPDWRAGEHLVIPLEWDGERRVSGIGWSDPRTHEGELMHPERIGPAEVLTLKATMKDSWDGQFNQHPRSMYGGKLKREWFQFYNPPGMERYGEDGQLIPVIVRVGRESFVRIPRAIPTAFEQVVQSIDCAFKDAAQNSDVAWQAWGRVGPDSYLLARDTTHRSFTETLALMRRKSEEIPCPEKLVEDAANGIAVVDTLKNEIPGIIPVKPYGSKLSRLAAVSPYVEAGNVWLPNPDVVPWVWELIDILVRGPKDDTDAMTQALKRLYDAQAQQGVPEFRVQPRLGEPRAACHVAEPEDIPIWFRRYVTIAPGQGALWFAETPTGSLRVLEELDLEGLDAESAGRAIAKRTLKTILARSSGPQDSKRALELYFPKLAFVPIEPHGSWAEMCEKALLAYVPEDGDYDLRTATQAAMRAARIRAEMVQEDDSALDRLRALLTWRPPDWEKVPYNRQKSLELAKQDLDAWADYMAQVEGEVRGEWPKLKIHPSCKRLIAGLGAMRRDRIDEAPALVRVLLLGVCVPSRVKANSGPREVPESQVKGNVAQMRPRVGRGSLMAKRFAMGRR